MVWNQFAAVTAAVAMVLLAGSPPAGAADAVKETSVGRPDAHQTRFAYGQQEVGDIKRAVKFYTTGLGMQVTRTFETADGGFKEISVAFDDNPNSTAIILTWRRQNAISLKPREWPMHMTLQVQDIRSAVARAKAAGAKVVRDFTPSAEGATTAEVADPDGNHVEILQLDPAPPAGPSKSRVSGRPDSHLTRVAYMVQMVWNLDRAVAFYTKVLGMQVTRTFESTDGGLKEVNVVYGDNPNASAIILAWVPRMTAPLPPQRWPLHAILQVEDIKGLMTRVAASGAKIVSREIFGPSTKLELNDSLREFDSAVNGFIEDPDGYQVELLQLD